MAHASERHKSSFNSIGVFFFFLSPSFARPLFLFGLEAGKSEVCGGGRGEGRRAREGMEAAAAGQSSKQAIKQASSTN